MEFKEVCGRITLPLQVCEKVNEAKAKLDLQKLEPIFERLLDRETAQNAYQELKEALGEDPDSMKMLACQLICAGRDHARYLAEGMSEAVFADTMKCFTRFLSECRVRTGEDAFDRGWWTWRQISMRLFRIGELEYELSEHAGEKAIAIHIPSDALFTPEKINDSLQQAQKFITEHFSAYSQSIYFCSSWLLSPHLAALLDEASNIRKFQERFILEKGLPQDTGYMEWLFGKAPGTPVEALPENTSLQKKVKEDLRAGKNLGAGVGRLKGM